MNVLPRKFKGIAAIVPLVGFLYVSMEAVLGSGKPYALMVA
jgi:hypothetical protein